MNAQSATQKLCDTSDMVIVHRMFRRERALLPQLVAAVAGGDVARARTVAGHAREVLDMLHHHHLGEDELLWPRLSARTRLHTDLKALVLTTVGAKSGTPRHTPVAYFPDGADTWLILASANGVAKNPAWYDNLAANPDSV